MPIEIEKCIIDYDMAGRPCRLDMPVGGEASGPGLRAVFDRRCRSGGACLRVDLNPMAPVEIRRCRLVATCAIGGSERIFCNGFQSWTDSRWFGPREAMPRLRTPGRVVRLHRFGDAHFYPYDGRPGRLHSHTYTAVSRRGQCVDLVGSLSEGAGYTLFAFDARAEKLVVEKDCSGFQIHSHCRIFNLLILAGAQDSVFDRYFAALKQDCAPGAPRSGWTSWYLHYNRITEQVVLKNLAAFSRRGIPLDIFQIDDGFQEAVGDWLRIRSAFPRGMSPVARAIHDAGYRAGLWLAPFVCEKKSRIYRRHSDWLLCDDDGRPVPAGWNPNWSGTFYALDLYNEDFRAYLGEVFHTVLDRWGFDMVKLDFLYAAAMEPRPERPRGGVMGDAMAFLRRCAGDRLVLGCGVPLGAAFGKVDYCRIGADVAPVWEDRLLNWLHYRERVSTANSLASTVGRRHLDSRAFGNDPDVFMLRAHDNRLTPAQRHTLFTLNNLFGSLVFTSDDIDRYDADQLALLGSMFPLARKKIFTATEGDGVLSVRFAMAGLRYRLFANLTPKARSLETDGAAVFCAEEGFSTALRIRLAAFTTRCWLEIGDQCPCVAGSRIHLFPGSEVASVACSRDRIEVELRPGVCTDGTVWVRVAGPGRYTANGRSTESAEVLPGVHTVAVSLFAEKKAPERRTEP